MITSLQNEQIKSVCKLHEKKGRDEKGLFIVEGRHLLEEAAASNFPLQSVFYVPESMKDPEDQALLEKLRPVSQEILEVNAEVMEKISSTQTPQGWLGVAFIPKTAIRPATRVVVFDRLQDPGNVGTILRTGLAFGVEDYYFIQGTADPYSPKVVRASQGAIFSANLVLGLTWPEIKKSMERTPLQLLAADPKGNLLPEVVNWRAGFTLVVGQEAAGISEEIANDVKRVKIPHRREVESLNAAVAAGILLYMSRKG